MKIRWSVIRVGTGLLGAAAVASPGCGDSDSERPSVTRGGSGGDAGDGGMGAGLVGDVEVPPESNLGAACSDDEDCSEGLRCITPDSDEFAGQGPPGGYCTADCDTTADCAEFGEAQCLEFGFVNPVGFCFLNCQPGAELSEDKCLGRFPGTACFEDPTGTQPGACLPLCQSDVECGTGLYCDPDTGLCSSSEPSGDPLGAACVQEETGLDDCQGACIGLLGEESDDPITHVCTQACTVGWACGWEDPSEPADGVCELISLDSNLGDVGWCRQLCDCNDDCRNPDLSCLGVLLPEEVAFFHRRGLCAVPVSEDDPVLPCSGGSAGAGGASAGGGPEAAGNGGAAGS